MVDTHTLLVYGSFAIAAMVMADVWLISNKRRLGWMISAIQNAAGIVYNLLTSQPGLLVMSAVLLVVSCKAWVQWKEQ